MRSMSFTRGLTLALGLTLPAVIASAQPREKQQDRRELRQDNKELRQDNRAIKDDIRDAQRYARLLNEFDQAATAQPARLVEIDRRVLNALDGEIRESNREVAQKGNEAARSQGEVRRSGAELGRDMARGQPVRAGDDRRDLRDDRRDARDDRRDAAREMGENNRLRSIHQEYSGLMNRMDPPSVARKRALLVELNRLAAAEVRGDVKEKREDVREKREDRRELREDRRQGPR